MGYYYNRTRVTQSTSAGNGRVLVFPPKQIAEIAADDDAVGGVRRLVDRQILARVAPPKGSAPVPVAAASVVVEPVALAPVPARASAPAPVSVEEAGRERSDKGSGKKKFE